MDENVNTGSNSTGSTLTAAIPFVGNLLSGILGNFAQSSANAQRYDMMREQNQFALDMWNRYNAYNTPANQMSRYMEAGINPFMAMSQISGGNASSSVVPQPAPSVEPVNSLSNSFAQMSPQISQYLTSMAMLGKIGQETDNLRLRNQFDAASLATRLNKLKFDTDSSEFKSNIDKYTSNLLRDTFSNQKTLSDISVSQAEQNLSLTQLQVSKQSLENQVLSFYKDKIQPRELDKIVQDIANMKASEKLSRQQISTEFAKRVLMYSQSGTEVERQKNLNANTMLTNTQQLKEFRTIDAAVDLIETQISLNKIGAKSSDYEYRRRSFVPAPLGGMMDAGEQYSRMWSNALSPVRSIIPFGIH